MKGLRGQVRRVPMPGIAVDVGATFALFGQAVVRGLRPPFSYGPEIAEQFRFTLRICWFPLILMSFAFSFGPAGIQASDFLGLFGALDRLGGAYVLITVREFAPFATAIILAGVAGTAICADLGARVVREETAALSVLGVDTVKSLVVPRLIVIVVSGLLFNILALWSGVLGAVVVTLENHAPLGPFFSSFFANANALEFGASMVKLLIYGTIIAIVACYKGMSVSGGPEGVARAVNQTVVISFLSIGAIDYVFTQLLLATHPILSQVRG